MDQADIEDISEKLVEVRLDGPVEGPVANVSIANKHRPIGHFSRRLDSPGLAISEAKTKSGRARVAVQHASATTKDGCSSVANSRKASKSNHPRVPKHETENKSLEVAGRVTRPNSNTEIARLRDELRQTKYDLQEALKRKEKAENTVVSYTKDFQEVLRASDQRNAELAACRVELGIVKNQSHELEDSRDIKQQVLDGRAFNDVKDIGFKRILHTNLETDVRMTRTFRLDARQWQERRNLRTTHDRAAVAYMRAFGNIYIAKAGQNPSKYQGFINSNHWTRQAVILSQKIGRPLKQNFATHVEPQLIALYITQYLECKGFQLSDFGDPKSYSNSGFEQSFKNSAQDIRIYVSQAICESCQRFVSAVNQRMSEHAYQFILKNAQEFADEDCDDKLCNVCRG
jgi:hypothetical protein